MKNVKTEQTSKESNQYSSYLPFPSSYAFGKIRGWAIIDAPFVTVSSGLLHVPSGTLYGYPGLQLSLGTGGQFAISTFLNPAKDDSRSGEPATLLENIHVSDNITLL